MKCYSLWQNMFHPGRRVDVSFPEEWDVQFHALQGSAQPALTCEQIAEKLNSPYGMPPLRELAAGKKQVAIAFDDNSRGTPTQPLAEAVLHELHAAGIQDSQIRFICALGTHGANNRRDFAAKLGEDIVRRYAVYNHNCYENCEHVGKTARGVEVYINKEFLHCDLKIGLGAVTPHHFNGYGGGSKILFPGLASIETVYQNHVTAIRFLRENHCDSTQMMGDLRMDGMRNEIEEMAGLVEGFFKVDCMYNAALEPVDLFAGNPIEAYYAAVKAAQEFYAVQKPVNRDIVVVNANAKATEASIAVSLGAQCLKAEGGDLVLVDHTDLGQVTHYLFSCFGSETGGRMCARQSAHNRPQVRRIICWMPHSEAAGGYWFGEQEKLVYANSWEEVLQLLAQENGPCASVSVFEDATLSYFPKL